MMTRSAMIGPCAVPSYPAKSWQSMRVNGREVWQLCGPTVDRLIDKHPLWLVFVSVYLEGVQHGSQAALAAAAAPSAQESQPNG